MESVPIDQNPGNLFPSNANTANGIGNPSPYGTNCYPSDRNENNCQQKEAMGFQQHHQQYQQQRHQLPKQSQHQHQQQQHQQHHHQQQQQRQQNQHHQHQHHNEMQKIQLQQHHQQHHQQHRQLLHQQQQRQAQMNDFRGPAPGQIKNYIDPNHFHQRQQDQQHLQLKFHLQQGEHLQHQQAQLQNFQLQRALPNHQQHQHHVGATGNFGTMAGSLTQRQQQQQLLASAASCNSSIWGVPPSGASSRHILERELTPRNGNGNVAVGRKRNITAVSGGITNTDNKNWNNTKTVSKQALRSEKKREQEKQRRSDLNEKFSALINVVKQIETEDEEVERKKIQAEKAIRKRKAEQEAEERELQAEGNGKEAGMDNGSSLAENSLKRQKVDLAPMAVSPMAEMISAERRDFKRRFPCFISPSNRSDLVARVVSHLVKYSKIRTKLNEEINAVRTKLEKVNKENKEIRQKLQHTEATATNPMVVTVGENCKDIDNAEKSSAKDETDKPIPSSSTTTTTTKDEVQQPHLQSQQQLQMMMMMPMIMNANGSFNQQCPPQFMPMPMPSMGAHLFNNMMMMSPVAQTAPVEDQGQQEGRKRDQDGTQNQEDEQSDPQKDSADMDGTPLKIETPVTNESDKPTIDETSSHSATGTSSSRSSSSPIPGNEKRVGVDGGTISHAESKNNPSNDMVIDKPANNELKPAPFSEESQLKSASNNVVVSNGRKETMTSENLPPSDDMVIDKPMSTGPKPTLLPEEVQQKPVSKDVVVSNEGENTKAENLPPSNDMAIDKPISTGSKTRSSPEELQPKEVSNDVVVPMEEKAASDATCSSASESNSCSNRTVSTKESSEKSISKISSQETPLVKGQEPNSSVSAVVEVPNPEKETASSKGVDESTKDPCNNENEVQMLETPLVEVEDMSDPQLSPVTNIPDPEKKLFPSPATPPEDPRTIDSIANPVVAKSPEEVKNTVHTPSSAEASDKAVVETNNGKEPKDGVEDTGEPKVGEKNDACEKKDEGTLSPATGADTVCEGKNSDAIKSITNLVAAKSPKEEGTALTATPIEASEKVVIDNNNGKELKDGGDDTREPQTDEKKEESEKKEEGPTPKQSQRLSQSTEALASTLLGLSRSPV